MNIDQLATIITGEFGWFNFLLIMIILIQFLGMAYLVKKVSELTNLVVSLQRRFR